MVTVRADTVFKEKFNKLKNNLIKEQVKKQIQKIIYNPKAGKPMQYGRRGTRELYIKPFRLSYAYLPRGNKIVLLDLYHKKKQ